VSANTQAQGRETSAKAKKEQDRLKLQVLELEEANRQQENELMELEKKNEAHAHANRSPKKSIVESTTGKLTTVTAATTAKKPTLPGPGALNDSAPESDPDLL